MKTKEHQFLNPLAPSSMYPLEEAKMARQHFQLIADIISRLYIPAVTKKEVARAFADELEATNSMFKRDAFLKATKVKPEQQKDSQWDAVHGRGPR